MEFTKTCTNLRHIYGAKVEIADNDGLTPLHIAANEGHVEVVRELLQHGASVYNVSKNGYKISQISR